MKNILILLEALIYCCFLYSDFQLNETYLFHGTIVPKNDICEEGLDTRLSSEGRFGRGTYFR